jgi:hypothetical protein
MTSAASAIQVLIVGRATISSTVDSSHGIGGRLVPTFMDVHDGMHVTSQQLAEAHKKDLEAQKGTGVEYVRYWLDSKAGKVFCLATGPNKDAVAAVHKKAGHPANELYEVSEGR